MNTNHSLFPVKLITILELFEKSKRGKESILYAKRCACVGYPEDGLIRAVMSSPQLFQVLNLDRNYRVRLAYTTSMLNVYETKLELYSHNGSLLQIMKHPDWSMELSLAIETELLERFCNINPL